MATNLFRAANVCTLQCALIWGYLTRTRSLTAEAVAVSEGTAPPPEAANASSLTAGWFWKSEGVASQCSLHNAPIFRLLLKVAVNGTHQCESQNFCGDSCPNHAQASCSRRVEHFCELECLTFLAHSGRAGRRRQPRAPTEGMAHRSARTRRFAVYARLPRMEHNHATLRRFARGLCPEGLPASTTLALDSRRPLTRNR